MAAVRYVRQRNGVYQYERRVPREVQDRPERFAAVFQSRPLFRRSLKTKEQGEMHAGALRVHREFEGMVAEALGRSPGPSTSARPAPPSRKVTQADIDEIVERFATLTARPFEAAMLWADSDRTCADELERLHYELSVDAENIQRSLQPGSVSSDPSIETPAETAKVIIQREGFEAPLGSKEFGLIAGAVRAGRVKGYKLIEALGAGDTTPTAPISSTGISASPQLTIRQAVERYLDHKKLPSKTVAEVNLALRTFESVVGNKALAGLGRGDFQLYVEWLANQSVGGKSAGSVKRPIAAQTVKKRVGFFNAAINHAIDRSWFEGPNPASNIKVEAYVSKQDPAIMPKKRPFKVGELNRLFEHPWFTGCKSATCTYDKGSFRLQGAEYWAPVVALLTGCRASELGGLMLSEVLTDDPHPHLIIRDNQYRRTKGGYARNVPILDALFDIGFKDYVDAVRSGGADRLFPDWESPRRGVSSANDDAAWSNAKLLRAFNRTVLPAALKDTLVAGARQEVTFHSFRGAFKAMLGSSEYRLHPNIINEVMGHAKSELDSRYVGTIPIEETYDAIRGCRFKGLILPTPAHFRR